MKVMLRTVTMEATIVAIWIIITLGIVIVVIVIRVTRPTGI